MARFSRQYTMKHQRCFTPLQFIHGRKPVDELWRACKPQDKMPQAYACGHLVTGFTFIEFLIYIAIIGAALAGFIQFILATGSARAQARAVSEVNANVRFIDDIITQKIHEAQNVLTPLEQAGSTSIILDMPAPSPDITFSVTNGILNLTEQGGSDVALTSKDVFVDGFLVSNYANLGERDNLRVAIAIRYNYQGAGVEYRYSRTLVTSASTRQ